MVVLIILIIIIVLGFTIPKIFATYSAETAGLVIQVTGIALLSIYLLSSCILALDSYLLEPQRQGIVETLEAVSTNGEFEHLSLDTEILVFNKSLREFQKANKNWIVFWGINDIVDELEPITEYRKE